VDEGKTTKASQNQTAGKPRSSPHSRGRQNNQEILFARRSSLIANIVHTHDRTYSTATCRYADGQAPLIASPPSKSCFAIGQDKNDKKDKNRMRHAISRSTTAAAAVAAVEKLQDWIANARMRRRGGGRWPTEVEREARYKRLHSVPFPSCFSILCNQLPRFRRKGMCPSPRRKL
jgi:hypothetical protein